MDYILLKTKRYGGCKMSDEIGIGIIICDRYRACGGGKCLRALHNREGAFSIYKDKEVK
ncbi:MAG: CGGC domain-containing protein, partial [Methanosarcinales archaeon]|nr:CGGC domain-containing protein [Methanosarcinales archaeon]